MPIFDIFETEIKTIEVVNNVTREVFDRDIRAASRPVIMRNLVGHWPAVKAGQTSPQGLGVYIKSQASNAPTPTYIGPPEIKGRYFYSPDMSGFNFTKRNIPLLPTIDKLISQLEDDAPIGIYAGATSTANSAPDFGKTNEMPLVDRDVEPLMWVGNSARIAPHFDTDENIACCVAGSRKFLLFPPEQLKNLYVGPLDRTMAGPPASFIDPRHVDLETYPAFETAIASAMVADLQPGDALYIPCLWWHYVESEGPLNVLVNYWWNDARSDEIMSSLALALLLLRERPLAERQAWKNMFDHYVFSDDAQNVVDHLPEQARGFLGPKSPQRDEYMKNYLRSKLSETLRPS